MKSKFVLSNFPFEVKSLYLKSILTVFFFIILVQGLSAQNENKIAEIFKTKIEHSLISRGKNFPDFETKKDSLDKFLFALHKGYSPKEFQEYTKFNNERMVKLIAFLESKNWLHKVNDKYKPTVFIADAQDGKLLYEYAEPISKKITALVTKNLPSIKSQFEQTNIAKTDDFQKWSFLILSNVLLDSWQIDNVEKDFLKQSNRPLRHGNHYYYKISENTNSKIESFGIYGNQYQKIGNKSICVYGNNRLNLKLTSSTNTVSKADDELFDAMAKKFLPGLLKILESERNYSKKVYMKLGYDKEISFEEFFIWWYHFIYTKATNQMNEKGILTIPANGNFDFFIEG